jgi:cobalt/nickel transport system permease protein
MSHLHVPDGVLPVWLWSLGLLLTFLLLGLALRSLRKRDLRHKLPLLAFTSALMLVGMSLHLVPLAYHLNLSVLAGILLGPCLGFVASFLVNFMLALVGHGGLTTVGLNTLILGWETFCGYWFFSIFRRWLRPPIAAGAAVLLALFLSTSLVIGLVAATRLDVSQFGKTTEKAHLHGPASPPMEKGNGHREGEDSHGHPLSLPTFALGAYLLGSIGWIVEALVVALVVAFLQQVKPEMISVPKG